MEFPPHTSIGYNPLIWTYYFSHEPGCTFIVMSFTLYKISKGYENICCNCSRQVMIAQYRA